MDQAQGIALMSTYQTNQFSLDGKGELKKHVDKISISNGLAWSLDHK